MGIETIRDPRDGVDKLMEVNPRFPRQLWNRTELGINEPLMCVQLARGEPVTPVDGIPGRRAVCQPGRGRPAVRPAVDGLLVYTCRRVFGAARTFDPSIGAAGARRPDAKLPAHVRLGRAKGLGSVLPATSFRIRSPRCCGGSSFRRGSPDRGSRWGGEALAPAGAWPARRGCGRRVPSPASAACRSDAIGRVPGPRRRAHPVGRAERAGRRLRRRDAAAGAVTSSAGSAPTSWSTTSPAPAGSPAHARSPPRGRTAARWARSAFPDCWSRRCSATPRRRPGSRLHHPRTHRAQLARLGGWATVAASLHRRRDCAVGDASRGLCHQRSGQRQSRRHRGNGRAARASASSSSPGSPAPAARASRPSAATWTWSASTSTRFAT